MDYKQIFKTSDALNMEVTVQDENNRLILERLFINKDIHCSCRSIFKNISFTTYDYELFSFDTPFSKIKRLEETIQMFLKCNSASIDYSQENSGFKVTISNDVRKTLTFGDTLSTLDKSLSHLQCAIGLDTCNNPVIIDVESLPHMMVCGTTGSGKSVCLNNIIINLMMNNSSNELKFVMIDPKQVELSMYDKVSQYLATPIITNLYEATTVLYNVQCKINERFAQFKKSRCKDINEFNAISDIKYPKLVIVIDELADLMIKNKKEVEPILTSIAQLGRACGVHLILSTQRPSREVITGLIKVNIPSQICFKVPTAINSRVAIDRNGAEKLLGKGDGYFLDGKSDEPVRFQGSFLTTDEIEDFLNSISK